MAGQKIAKMKEFKSLEDFISGSNNFFSLFGDRPPHKLAVQRFKEKYPEVYKEITDKINKAYRVDRYNLPDIDNWHALLPWQDLYNVYQLMSQMVHEDDPDVIRGCGVDNWYLCR